MPASVRNVAREKLEQGQLSLPRKLNKLRSLPSALVGFGAITGGCGKWASASEAVSSISATSVGS